MTELKPCPFCGEIPVVFSSYAANAIRTFTGYFVSCDNIDCEQLPESDRYWSKEEAINDWNRRVDDGKTD